MVAKVNWKSAIFILYWEHFFYFQKFQKIPSIKSIIGDFATVVMVDLLDGVYNVFTHSQFLASQDYMNCIRTEDGFCGIEWKEKSGTSKGGVQIIKMEI